MKILITDKVDPLLTESLSSHQIQYKCNFNDSTKKLLKIIDEFDGLIVRNRLKINREFLNNAKNLKFIARYGSGMDSIDLTTAAKLDIKCFNSGEGNANSVGEHALGMILSLLHNIHNSTNEVKLNIWERKKNTGNELGSKTIGIIGYGNTGQSLANKISGFNCKVLAYDKYKSGFGEKNIKECSMEDIYNDCDIISLHVPLNAETINLLDEQFLERMKNPFYLINTSRGRVVHNKDLIRGLKRKKVLGACLDVIENENFQFNEINNDENFNYLVNCSNVIITPHIAGLSKQSSKEISKVLIKKIIELK
ncbi:MAG: hypothetical protein CMP62_04735 [Flavobacteriales bacterium]|nr:hypothetical protein [Flavobacteriales bacterium]